MADDPHDDPPPFVIDLGEQSRRETLAFAEFANPRAAAAALLADAEAEDFGLVRDFYQEKHRQRADRRSAQGEAVVHRMPGRGVPSADNRTLGLVAALLHDIADAIDEDDGQALLALADLSAAHKGIAEENDRILRARKAVAEAIQLVKSGPPKFEAPPGWLVTQPEHDTSGRSAAEFLRFILGALDERFLKLDVDATAAVLVATATHETSTGKDGRGHKGQDSVLKELVVSVGAFDCNSPALADRALDKANRQRRRAAGGQRPV